MIKSFLNKHKVRGLRNNNPGNLIHTSIPWQGKLQNSTDSRFEQFLTLGFGIRAMLKDLIHDINSGENTITKLIHQYAPPSENNTSAYIESVSMSTGIAPNAVLKKIDANFLQRIARAIFKVELGKAHTEVTDTDIFSAIKTLGNVSTKSLTVLTDVNFFFNDDKLH